MEQNLKLEAARALGFKGGEPTEAERLLFEAWMLGHCWKIHGDWDGKSYTHATEKGGGVHGGAMQTRQLWAVWRDRAALGAQHVAALEAEVERLKAAQQAQPEPSEMTTERESYIAGLESRTHEMRKKIEQLDYELRVARSSQERATYTPPKIIDPDAPHPCFN